MQKKSSAKISTNVTGNLTAARPAVVQAKTAVPPRRTGMTYHFDQMAVPRQNRFHARHVPLPAAAYTPVTPGREHTPGTPIQRMKDENIEAIKSRVDQEGLSITELKQAIREKLQEERSLDKSDHPITDPEVEEVVKRITKEKYLELYRIQDELAHTTPPSMVDAKTGADSFRAISQADDPVNEKAAIAHMAARHTYGLKDGSSFVSLARSPEALAASTDVGKGKENVSNVVHNAKHLVRYMVPRQYAWTPEDMLGAIKKSDWADVPIEDTTAEEWLPGPPTKETETLYYGSDLLKYQSDHQKNPFRKTGKKRH